jgi:hypothetical protein
LKPPVSQKSVTSWSPAASSTGTCTDWYVPQPPVSGTDAFASTVPAASRTEIASAATAPVPLATRSSRS